jgi:hypothetical protein
LNILKLFQEVESIINDLPKQKAAGMDVHWQLLQTIVEEIKPIFWNLFQKVEAEKCL